MGFEDRIMYLCLLIWSTPFSTVCRRVANASTIGYIHPFPYSNNPSTSSQSRAASAALVLSAMTEEKGIEESHWRVETLMQALEITSDQLLVKGSYGDIVAAS